MNKDLGFFAKHTEKIVLGIAILLLVGVAAYSWLGVLGAPHTTASGETPADLEDAIDDAASNVRANLTNDRTNLPTPEEFIVPDYATVFEGDYREPITPLATLDAPLESLGLPQEVLGDLQIDFDPLFLPTPPMASSFSIKTKHGVLADTGAVSDPEARAQVVAIQQLVGDQAPVDFQYVSVMAEFPLREWAQRLDAPEQPARRQIPDNVWLAKLGIASVYLVREEQQLDGSWGNRTVVEPLPGQIAFEPGDPIEQQDPLFAQELLAEAQGLQGQITQPAFPPLANGAWTPPTGSDRVLSAEEQERLEDIDGDIRRLERRIAQLRGEDTRGTTQRRPRTQRGGGMGEDLGMDGGMGDSRRATRDTRRGGTTDREAERAAQRIADTEQELRDKIAEKNELLGIDDDAAQMEFLRSRGGMGGGMGMMDEFGMGGMGMDGMGMSSPMNRNQPMQRGNQAGGLAGLGGLAANPTDEVPETVRVWAHDVTAQPGKTYRYKLVAATINPLFQYTRLPRDQREANEYRLAIAPSEEDFDAAPWTTPVTLDPEAYFFFVRGNAEQDRATIEVWRVWNGLWRQDEFEETPGNPIGGETRVEVAPGIQRDVDLAVGNVLLDVDVIEVNGTNSVRMVFLDADGNISGRLLREDRNDPKRRELEEAVEQQQAQDLALRP
ncbi:MAG: hypothetical protein AAF916_09990 [Planctomycetota bacterium]